MAPSPTLRMWEIYPISTPHVRLRVQGNAPNKDSLGGGQLGGVCIGLDSDRAGWRTLEKSSRRDRDRVCAKFKSSRRFRGSNMKPKKKVASLPRPRPRFRPRFCDLSFHLQLCNHHHSPGIGNPNVNKGYN